MPGRTVFTPAKAGVHAASRREPDARDRRWIPAFAGVTGLGMLFASCAQPPARGGGIVSVNPCADAILVRLAPSERIAAISRYSHDPAATSMPLDVARRFPITAGTAEEVVALRPDLVLASSFTSPATRAAFERAGLRALYLRSPATIAASRAQVLEVADAVGEPGKGRALAAEIDRATATAAPRGLERPAALLFIAGTLANGSGNLLDEMITRAGFTNAAARYGLSWTGTLPAEPIVRSPPDIVIVPARGGRAEAMRERLLPRTPVATFPRELVNCGGPSIAPALARLAAIRRSL